MGKINILNKNVSELIAAGEVIERPASIVKELLENSIDAKATAITVEIKNGGIGFIRITDNGIGFEREDVPLAFLRHATSKVSNELDLDHIGTLGFRGEALASISAVAKVELLSKTQQEQLGTRMVVHGGETISLDDAGCPNGTTIIVRDLFYNVPARLKFLKKDFSEGNAIQSIVEKIAISHPEISFKMIKENKTVLHTAGDSQLISAIHAVLGRDFANSLIEVDYEYKGIRVYGFVSKPSFCRNNRTMQHFFVNERYVKSRTCLVSLEEAYKNSIMVSKFPACVLKLETDYSQVDVNVHPAKIEVRFVDEKAVYEAIYFGVKSALSKADILKTDVNQERAFIPKAAMAVEEKAAVQTTLPTLKQKTVPAAENPKQGSFLKISAADYQAMSGGKGLQLNSPHFSKPVPAVPSVKEDTTVKNDPSPSIVQKIEQVLSIPQGNPQAFDNPAWEPAEDHFQFLDNTAFVKKQEILETPAPAPIREEIRSEEAEPVRVRMLGELFKTYILCEINDVFVMLDKHAAHERILFEKLRQQLNLRESQILLAPVVITLSIEECSVIRSNFKVFEEYGFGVRFPSENTVEICGAPLILHNYDLVEILQNIAKNILTGKVDLTPASFEELLHSIACKSAIKANMQNTEEELEELVKQVYLSNKIRHCPHGRPVGITMTKYEVEKKFGRHQ